MDIAGLVGVDSISSLDQENNILSARSNSSLSSMDDVLSDHPLRKKKSSTLSRLRYGYKIGNTDTLQQCLFFCLQKIYSKNVSLTEEL